MINLFERKKNTFDIIVYLILSFDNVLLDVINDVAKGRMLRHDDQHSFLINRLMFSEEFEHFHCILRGNKSFVVNTFKYPDVCQIRKKKIYIIISFEQKLNFSKIVIQDKDNIVNYQLILIDIYPILFIYLKN